MSAAPATRCVRQSGFIKVGEHMRQPVGTSAEIGLGYGAACAPTIQWTTLAVAETFPVGLRALVDFSRIANNGWARFQSFVFVPTISATMGYSICLHRFSRWETAAFPQSNSRLTRQGIEIIVMSLSRLD